MINKMYIYTMEYNSAINKKKIMSFAAIWLQREFLILNEENQKEEKQIPYDITSI